MYVVESACHQYEDPYQIVGALPQEQEDFRSNVHFEEHANIPVFDLRSCSEILSLERHGIELMHCGKMPPVDVRTTAGVEVYLRWIVDAMKKKFSPELIIVYNYNYRSSELHKYIPGQTVGTVETPDAIARDLHTDATKSGGRHRVRRHLSDDEAEKYFDGSWRLQILNAWKPLSEVVQDAPLAFCDPMSICEKDLLLTKRPGEHYTGEVYYVKHNASQRMYYFRGQQSEEITLFSTFDSESRGVTAGGVPHASFVDPHAQPRCPPRESVECRMIMVSKVSGQTAGEVREGEVFH